MHSQVLDKKRYFLLDELRGFLVLLMVVYHGLLSVYLALDNLVALRLFDFFTPVEPFFAGGFILISGICCRFSRSNLIRGLKLLAVALLINFFTVVITAVSFLNISILFGILNLLSFCMIFVGLTEKLLQKIPPVIGMVISLILFVLALMFVSHINFSYQNTESPYLFPLGYVRADFESADYFPILPWVFLYLIGYFLGQTGVFERNDKLFAKSRIPLLGFIGKYAIVIYILHQPVIFGAAYLLGVLING